MQTIARLLSDVRSRTPGATAVAYRGGRLTFAELDDAARRAARGLSELGVGHGDRVALRPTSSSGSARPASGQSPSRSTPASARSRWRDIVRRSGARVLALWPGFRGIPFLDLLGEIDRSALERLEALVVYGEGRRRGKGRRPAAAGRPRRPTPSPPRSPAAGGSRFRTSSNARPSTRTGRRPATGPTCSPPRGTTRAPKFVLHSHASVTAHAPHHGPHPRIRGAPRERGSRDAAALRRVRLLPDDRRPRGGGAPSPSRVRSTRRRRCGSSTSTGCAAST